MIWVLLTITALTVWSIFTHYFLKLFKPKDVKKVLFPKSRKPEIKAWYIQRGFKARHLENCEIQIISVK